MTNTHTFLILFVSEYHLVYYFYSELFYDNSLIPMAKQGAILDEIQPQEPMAFYGVQGEESRDPLSLGYENFVEAREVGGPPR